MTEKYAAAFTADRTANLITRLHHNVIRTGLHRINLAYSRISLKVRRAAQRAPFMPATLRPTVLGAACSFAEGAAGTDWDIQLREAARGVPAILHNSCKTQNALLLGLSLPPQPLHLFFSPSAQDIAAKLALPSAEDAEFICAKAIRDGGLAARLDRAGGYLASSDVADVYSTAEPQAAFHARIAFCLDIHNEAVKVRIFRERGAVM